MLSNRYVANRFFPSKDYVVIDIHCHLLPQVDDGPQSWDIAVEMCRMAAADGITHTVATPHANDRYAYDRTYLSELLDQLREKSGSALQLSLGCDFHLSFENLERVLEHPQTYTIGQTNYLLIELSNYSVPPQLSAFFTRLADRRVTPILTHPERNPILQETPQRILEWAEQGCLIQVTASALTGFWGERPEIIAHWLPHLSAGHVLASVAHPPAPPPPRPGPVVFSWAPPPNTKTNRAHLKFFRRAGR